MTAAGGTSGMRSVLQTVKTIEYQYAAPVREVITRLRLFPCARRGAQRLVSRECEVWPRPDRTRRFADDYGNPVWEFLHREVTERLRFVLDFTTEYAGASPWARPTSRLRASHGVPIAGMESFLEHTSLVDESEEIRRVARHLSGSGATAGELMVAIGHWVHETMQFRTGVTNVN